MVVEVLAGGEEGEEFVGAGALGESAGAEVGVEVGADAVAEGLEGDCCEGGGFAEGEVELLRDEGGGGEEGGGAVGEAFSRDWFGEVEGGAGGEGDAEEGEEKGGAFHA